MGLKPRLSPKNESLIIQIKKKRNELLMYNLKEAEVTVTVEISIVNSGMEKCIIKKPNKSYLPELKLKKTLIPWNQYFLLNYGS